MYVDIKQLATLLHFLSKIHTTVIMYVVINQLAHVENKSVQHKVYSKE